MMEDVTNAIRIELTEIRLMIERDSL